MIRDEISKWLYLIDPRITHVTYLATMKLLDTVVSQTCGSPKADLLDWFRVEEMFCIAAACLSIVRQLFGETSIDCYLRHTVNKIAKKPCKLYRLKREILKSVDLRQFSD